MADQDEREEELSSITAIFPELAINPDDPFAASIDLPVAPLSPLAIAFPALDGAPPQTLPTPTTPDNEGATHKNGPPGRTAAREVHRLSYLPPLKLQIALPEGYPTEKPPHFTIETTAKWVPEHVLKQLVDQGEVLWEEYGRGQVVFAYMDFLQQAAEKCFDLVDDGNKDVLEMPAELKIELLDFDMQAKRRRFEHETFDCGVCLEPKKGSACYRLRRCGHVFCVGCLQDFYNNCIAEGDVASVRCIDPGCGKDGDAGARKKDRTLNPSELLQISIEKSVVQRYAELKRKKKIESDKDTIYCPRSWCQGFARSSKHPKITDLTQVPDSDGESDGEDNARNKDEQSFKERASRLTVCEKCEYAFCRVCLAGWHGEYVRCYPRNSKELSEEEQASYNWLRRYTSPCPTCLSPCQKTHGCNHMVCFQCRTHFCYLCSHWLEPENPYQHFNTEGAPCYMRLWELEEGDEAEGNPDGGRGVFAGGLRGWEADVLVAADEDAARELQAEEDAAAAAIVADDRHPLPANNPHAQRNPHPNPHPHPPAPAPPPELQLVIGLDALRLAEEQQRELPRGPPRAAPPIMPFQFANPNLVPNLNAIPIPQANHAHLPPDNHAPLRGAPAAAANQARQRNHNRNRNPNQQHFGNGNQNGARRRQQRRQQQNQQPNRNGAHGRAAEGRTGVDDGGGAHAVGQGRGGVAGERRVGVGVGIGVAAAAAVAAGQGDGLQRFLRMVVADEEDGWDSDELEGEEGAWVIPVRE